MALDNMEGLFSIDKRAYGKEYLSHYLEQYKLFVESVEKISDRRQQANNYFIAINTALISIIGISFQIESLKNADLLRLLLAIIGVFTCVIFWFLIRSYKQLNTGKFSVIHEVEKHLPLSLYAYEWKVLGSGGDKNKYLPFSHIELLIPWMFGFLYIFLGIYFIAPSMTPATRNFQPLCVNRDEVLWCLLSRHFDRQVKCCLNLQISDSKIFS